MTPVAAVLGLYLVVQFGIGVWAARRIKSEDDYLVAGRKLGYPLAIFSIFATWFGAETCIGAAGDIHANGISLTTAEPFGYGLCIVLMGVVFAVPLWRRKLTTLADLFRERYSTSVERVAAVFLIPTSILWAAAQVRAFGNVLSTVTVLNVEAALTVAAAVAILYTAFGGLLADAVTDLVQGVALTIGLCILFVATLLYLGGPSEALATITAGGGTPAAGAERASLLETAEAWAIPVLGSVVATELVSRIIAARTPSIARNSALAAGGIYVTVGLIPAFIGLVGWRLVPDLANPEQLLPAVAQRLFPGALYAVFAGAIISAILSTVDSTLLIASGLFSHNLLMPLARFRSERAKVRSARAAVVSFGIVAYILAIRSEGVLALVEQASAFGSSGSLVIVCFGLFTGFGGWRAAMATLVAGMGTYVLGTFGEWSVPFLTSLAAALGTYIVVGWWEMRRPPPTVLTAP
jgi:Na+/proline symporter